MYWISLVVFFSALAVHGGGGRASIMCRPTLPVLAQLHDLQQDGKIDLAGHSNECTREVLEEALRQLEKYRKEREAEKAAKAKCEKESTDWTTIAMGTSGGTAVGGGGALIAKKLLGRKKEEEAEAEGDGKKKEARTKATLVELS